MSPKISGPRKDASMTLRQGEMPDLLRKIQPRETPTVRSEPATEQIRADVREIRDIARILAQRDEPLLARINEHLERYLDDADEAGSRAAHNADPEHLAWTLDVMRRLKEVSESREITEKAKHWYDKHGRQEFEHQLPLPETRYGPTGNILSDRETWRASEVEGNILRLLKANEAVGSQLAEKLVREPLPMRSYEELSVLRSIPAPDALWRMLDAEVEAAVRQLGKRPKDTPEAEKRAGLLHQARESAQARGNMLDLLGVLDLARRLPELPLTHRLESADFPVLRHGAADLDALDRAVAAALQAASFKAGKAAGLAAKRLPHIDKETRQQLREQPAGHEVVRCLRERLAAVTTKLRGSGAHEAAAMAAFVDSSLRDELTLYEAMAARDLARTLGSRGARRLQDAKLQFESYGLVDNDHGVFELICTWKYDQPVEAEQYQPGFLIYLSRAMPESAGEPETVDSEQQPVIFDTGIPSRDANNRFVDHLIDLDGRLEEGVWYAFMTAYRNYHDTDELRQSEISNVVRLDLKASKKGDLNGDGVIDLGDLNRLTDLLLDGDVVTYWAADVNDDGLVDQADVEALIRLIESQD